MEVLDKNGNKKSLATISNLKTYDIFIPGIIGYEDISSITSINIENASITVNSFIVYVLDGNSLDPKTATVTDGHIKDNKLTVTFKHSRYYMVWTPCVIRLNFTLL